MVLLNSQRCWSWLCQLVTVIASCTLFVRTTTCAFQTQSWNVKSRLLKRSHAGHIRIPTPSRLHASNPQSKSKTEQLTEIGNIERIFAISDLHTDKISNLEWLREMCLSHRIMNNGIGPNDALIIAGDISHDLTMLKETFCIIKEHLNCHIFFVWGNHEAWIGGQEMDSLGIESSLQKIEFVKSLCSSLGVYTDCKLVGTSHDNPVVIMPIESWYDASLSLHGCEDLCKSFDTWKWVDFIRCVWPQNKTLLRANSIISKSNDIITDMLLQKLQFKSVGQIPLGLTELLYHRNNKSIRNVQQMYLNWIKDDKDIDGKTNTPKKNIPPGLITFSHFLPNQKTLPDWKDPTSDTFHREEWLDHPVPEISAKFAKVAGSILIDEQIRSIIPRGTNIMDAEDVVSNCLQTVQHLHVFGHSHRPKDFVLDNVRYIHNPLGKPAEREMNMVSQDVGPQLIWDCRSQSLQNNRIWSDTKDDSLIISSVGMNRGIFGGEIPGTQVIRYWEEQGGGKETLARKMRHRKRRRRIELKRLIRDLELSKQNLETSDTKIEKNL